jgi:hypothetical protein
VVPSPNVRIACPLALVRQANWCPAAVAARLPPTGLVTSPLPAVVLRSGYEPARLSPCTPACPSPGGQGAGFEARSCTTGGSPVCKLLLHSPSPGKGHRLREALRVHVMIGRVFVHVSTLPAWKLSIPPSGFPLDSMPAAITQPTTINLAFAACQYYSHPRSSLAVLGFGPTPGCARSSLSTWWVVSGHLSNLPFMSCTLQSAPTLFIHSCRLSQPSIPAAGWPRGRTDVER